MLSFVGGNLLYLVAAALVNQSANYTKPPFDVVIGRCMGLDE